MPSPQSGIFAENSAHHYFLEWPLHPGVEESIIRQQISAAIESSDPSPDRAGQHLVVALGDRAWNRLSLSEQEKIIGRTKKDSLEFDSDRMPPDAHVARSDFSEQGTALKIDRRSVPYGTVSEHGLYFLCFACDLRRIEIIPERMFGISDDGIRDRITDFTRAAAGAFWFAPSKSELKAALQP